MILPSRAFLMSFRMARADTLLPPSPMTTVATSSTANLSIAIRLSRYSTQLGVPSAVLLGRSTRIRYSCLVTASFHPLAEFFDCRCHIFVRDLIHLVIRRELAELLLVGVVLLLVSLMEGLVNPADVRPRPPAAVNAIPERLPVHLDPVRVQLDH